MRVRELELAAEISVTPPSAVQLLDGNDTFVVAIAANASVNGMKQLGSLFERRPHPDSVHVPLYP